MQRQAFPIIQILFLAVIVGGITVVAIGSTKSVAVPAVLGALLFFAAIGAFRNPGEKGEFSRRRIVEVRQTLMTNKGLAIVLALIAIAAFVLAALAVKV
ncbi:MAG: hypothetical protein RL676_1195 [Pseudomonadota bacterium]|jgi:hypothetical protein